MAECDCCKDDGNMRHVPRKRNYQKLVEVSVPAYGLVLSNRLKEDACLQRRPVCTAAALCRDGGTEVLPMPCPKFTPDDPHEHVYQRRLGKKYCASKAEYERAPCRDCRKREQVDSGMQRRLFEKDRQVDRGMERRRLEKDRRVDSGMEQRRFEKERHIYSGIQRKRMETDHRNGKDIQRLQESGSGDDGFKRGLGGGGYLPKNDERYGRTGERRNMKGTEYIILVENDGSPSTASDSVPSIQSSSSTRTRSSVVSSSSGDKASLRKGDKVTVCMPCVNKSKRGENFILKGDKLKVARKDQPKEKARQEDRSANTRTRNSGRCGKGSNIGKTVDYAYRCESRELIGSKMIISCDCVKRNGLQDQCRRTACRGRAPCLVTPWPDCWPSGGKSGVDKTRTIGVARYNPVVEYRQDKVMCSDGRNKLAFQPDGRRH